MNEQATQANRKTRKQDMTIPASNPHIIAQTAQYVSQDLLARWQQLSALQGQKCRVGCIGLLKAGKSSLCNALTDSLDDRRFAVGFNRTTTANQEWDCGDYLLLDTPGLDCNENDSRETTSLLESLDIIIFAHNLNTGEFDKHEQEFMWRLAPSKERSMALLDKTFWALTKLDECTKNDARQLEQKITSQIARQIGVTPRYVFTLGSTRYKKGMTENKQLMVQKSNIPAFRDALRNDVRSKQQQVAAERQMALRDVRQQIVGQLHTVLTEKTREITDYAQKRTALKSKFGHGLVALHERLQQYANKQQEM